MDVGNKNKLLGYLGSANVSVEYRIKKNTEILRSELLRLCSEVYGVRAETTAELASKIDDLGKAERRRLCRAFRSSHGLPHPQQHKHRDLEPRINEFPATPQKLNLRQNQPDYIPQPAPSPDLAHMQPVVRLSAKKLRRLELAERKEKKAGPLEGAIREFYASWEWKRLSYDTKLERGRRCECCGAKAPDVKIITDHVKPIRHHWHLRLDKSNLQVLCDDCNMGKGSRDETDFRTLNAYDPFDEAPPPDARVLWQ